MRVRDLLKTDFDYDVIIASGVGTRGDPFVIEPSDEATASLTQYRVLQGLGRGRREIWRVLSNGVYAEDHAARQWIEIETVHYTDTDIVTERRRLFFDISAVEGAPDAMETGTAWRSPALPFEAPYHLEWIHFDGVTVNADPRAPVDVSLFYSGIGAKATVYVYEGTVPSDADPAVSRDEELRRACQRVESQYPEATDPWRVQHAGALALRYYLIGETLSVVGVARRAGYFLKLRLTFTDDLKMRELMTAVVQRLALVAEAF